MPLTGLHTDWQKGSYSNDRNFIIKGYENAPLRDGTNLSGLNPCPNDQFMIPRNL
jgi:hypothetical protein